MQNIDVITLFSFVEVFQAFSFSAVWTPCVYYGLCDQVPRTALPSPSLVLTGSQPHWPQTSVCSTSGVWSSENVLLLAMWFAPTLPQGFAQNFLLSDPFHRKCQPPHPATLTSLLIFFKDPLSFCILYCLVIYCIFNLPVSSSAH